jgi:hypothetical protein
MNSLLIEELARTAVAQRHHEAAAYRRANLARRATAKATRFITRVTNRPRVPAQRKAEQGHEQHELVGGGRVRG